MKSILLGLMLFWPIMGHAVIEADFDSLYKSEIKPFYQTGKTVVFESFDGVKINTQQFLAGNKKAIVILTGRTEPTNKYAEVIYDLREKGYDFYLMDARGQGFSERLLPDPKAQYIKNYKNWVRDIEELFSRYIDEKEYEEVVFLGHSMGAGIGLRFAQIHPGKFSKIIVSAPMVEMLLGGKNERVVSTLMGLLIFFGKGKDYVPSQGEFDPSFEANRVTHSKARWQMARDLETENPHLLMAEATNKWVKEGIQLGRKIYRDRKKLHSTPILMFQAGIEHFSRYERQNKICDEHPDCKKVFFEQAKHEMFMEVDEIRDVVMKEIVDMLAH